MLRAQMIRWIEGLETKWAANYFLTYWKPLSGVNRDVTGNDSTRA